MKFFLDAGIPKESSAEYAVNFEENRMEMDMLAELDKDLLRYNIWSGLEKPGFSRILFADWSEGCRPNHLLSNIGLQILTSWWVSKSFRIKIITKMTQIWPKHCEKCKFSCHKCQNFSKSLQTKLCFRKYLQTKIRFFRQCHREGLIGLDSLVKTFLAPWPFDHLI